jgi:hypothetical protein
MRLVGQWSDGWRTKGESRRQIMPVIFILLDTLENNTNTRSHSVFHHCMPSRLDRQVVYTAAMPF